MAKNPDSVNDKAVWVYCGDGLGIPGLPHRLSREQAQEQQVLDAFEDAISTGVYQLETKPAVKPEQEKE